jgi:hypothetical protein
VAGAPTQWVVALPVEGATRAPVIGAPPLPAGPAWSTARAAAGGRGKFVGRMLKTIKHEISEIIPPTVFFFIAFLLLLFTKKLILEDYGIRVSALASAAVGALIVGKVVLIVDHFPFVNKFPGKPLMYNITWKTVLYLIAAFVVRYLEHLFEFFRKYGSVIEANRHLLTEVVWPYFWLVQVWLSVLLLIFCGFRELVRAIGRDRVMGMFFGKAGR